MTSAKDAIRDWFGDVYDVAGVKPENHDLAARDLITTLEQIGFAIVPVEPTEAMMRVCDEKELCYVVDTLPDEGPSLYWKTMISAAKGGG